MGIEHFISVIDRASIDAVLSLSWREFNLRYQWTGSQWSSAAEFLQDFAYDSESDPSTIDDIIERRSLRWSMNRCSPKLFFMYEIIEHVPDLRTRCLSYTPRDLNDMSVVHAVAAEAFVRGDISRAVFFSVLRFCERLNLGDAIDLKKPHYKEVVRALKSWVPSMPPFRWLSLDYFGEGYACLNIRETTSVVTFLERAWKGKWAAPSLSDWARGKLGISNAVNPTVRDSDAARQILRWFRSSERRGMCLVSYVEASL